jgi:hypothetical protein
MPPKYQNQPSQVPQARPLSNYQTVREQGFRNERDMTLSYGFKNWPIDDDELAEFKAISDGLREHQELERAESGEQTTMDLQQLCNTKSVCSVQGYSG